MYMYIYTHEHVHNPQPSICMFEDFVFVDTFFYVGTYGAPSGMNGTIVPHYSGAYVILHILNATIQVSSPLRKPVYRKNCFVG